MAANTKAGLDPVVLIETLRQLPVDGKLFRNVRGNLVLRDSQTKLIVGRIDLETGQFEKFTLNEGK